MKRKFKTYQKVLAGSIVFTVCAYFFLYKGDNRLTIWLHHGLWLPKSTEKIDFYTYPGVMAHLIGIDDWAKTNLELPKSELKEILTNQEYQYVTSIDTSASGQVRTFNMSGYRQIPDSILNG